MAERILVVGPAWIGDMVMAQSLFKLIKQRRPQVQIDVVAPAWTESLLARMPEVAQAFSLPVGHGDLALGTRWKLGRRLRERDYEQAIILPNSLKSALIPFVASVRRRTGFLGEYRWGLLNDVRRLDKKMLPRRVDTYIALGLDKEEPMLTSIPQPTLNASRSDAHAALTRLGQELPSGPVLGMCPGAEYGPAKRWPASYFAQVASAQLARGWQVWLFGSGKDVPITEEIQALTDSRCLNLGGRTSLDECINLMSLVTTVVTNDSGLMHVAASLDRDLVAVYGCTSPEHNPPLHPRARILYLGLDCSPCYQRECPLEHLNCLRQLRPAQVLESLDAQVS
ncbi:MAG: lipopolysaccharide heptosyltransferase II [Gammaproteobacteria bacterium]|nr:lipopolysaccharide heptosyltransferase II [Gammaproteobacteria bacterium]